MADDPKPAASEPAAPGGPAASEPAAPAPAASEPAPPSFDEAMKGEPSVAPPSYDEHQAAEAAPAAATPPGGAPIAESPKVEEPAPAYDDNQAPPSYTDATTPEAAVTQAQAAPEPAQEAVKEPEPHVFDSATKPKAEEPEPRVFDEAKKPKQKSYEEIRNEELAKENAEEAKKQKNKDSFNDYWYAQLKTFTALDELDQHRQTVMKPFVEARREPALASMFLFDDPRDAQHFNVKPGPLSIILVAEEPKKEKGFFAKLKDGIKSLFGIGEKEKTNARAEVIDATNGSGAKCLMVVVPAQQIKALASKLSQQHNLHQVTSKADLEQMIANIQNPTLGKS